MPSRLALDCDNFELNTQAVQEAVATSVEDMLAECPSPSVLRAATVSLVGSKKGETREPALGWG